VNKEVHKIATVWNNRDDRFNPNGGNGGDSFEEHAEHMRAFRKSYARNLKVRTALLKSMRTFHVTHTITETAGVKRSYRCEQYP